MKLQADAQRSEIRVIKPWDSGNRLQTLWNCRYESRVCGKLETCCTALEYLAQQKLHKPGEGLTQSSGQAAVRNQEPKSRVEASGTIQTEVHWSLSETLKTPLSHREDIILKSQQISNRSMVNTKSWHTREMQATNKKTVTLTILRSRNLTYPFPIGWGTECWSPRYHSVVSSWIWTSELFLQQRTSALSLCESFSPRDKHTRAKEISLSLHLHTLYNHFTTTTN